MRIMTEDAFNSKDNPSCKLAGSKEGQQWPSLGVHEPQEGWNHQIQLPCLPLTSFGGVTPIFFSFWLDFAPSLICYFCKTFLGSQGERLRRERPGSKLEISIPLRRPLSALITMVLGVLPSFHKVRGGQDNNPFLA